MSMHKVGLTTRKPEIEKHESSGRKNVDFVRKVKGAADKVVQSLSAMEIFAIKLNSHSRHVQSKSTHKNKHVYLPLESKLKKLHESISLAIHKVVKFIQKRLQISQMDIKNRRYLAKGIKDLREISERLKEKSQSQKSDFQGLVGMSKNEAQNVLSKLEVRKEIKTLCDSLDQKWHALVDEISSIHKQSAESNSTDNRNWKKETLDILHETNSANKELLEFDEDLKSFLGDKSSFVFRTSKSSSSRDQTVG